MILPGTITLYEPTEEGALVGYGQVCPTCGTAVKASLPSLARQWVREHAEWHERTGR